MSVESSRPGPYLDVRDFVRGNPDALPGFQDAGDSLTGGGDLLVPPGDYTFASSVTSNGLWQWVITNDNVRVHFAPGARLISTVPGARVIAALGSAKPAGIGNWFNNQFDDAPGYTITAPIEIGTFAFTLATPADADNFPVDAFIWLRTGQLLGDATGAPEPDSEINQVLFADPGTGRVQLRWPTTRAYQQEYYLVGTSGMTSPVVTANPAIYAAHVVSDRVLRGIEFHNPVIDCAGQASAQLYSFWEGIDFKIIGGRSTYPEGGYGSRDMRFVEIGSHRWERQTRRRVDAVATGGSPTTIVDTTQHWPVNQWNNSYVLYIYAGTGAGQARQIQSNTLNTITILTGQTWTTPPDNTSRYFVMLRYYSIAPSCGCTDFTIRDNVIVSDTESYLHIHEGIANSQWFHNTVMGWTATSVPLVSIAQRCHNLDISNNLFIVDVDPVTNGSNGVNIANTQQLPGTRAGRFANNTLVARRGQSNIRVDGPGWDGLETNRISSTPPARMGLRGTQIGVGHDLGNRLTCVATAAKPTIALGQLPRHGTVTRVQVEGLTQATAGATLKVGHATDDDAYLLATAIDVAPAVLADAIKVADTGAGVALNRQSNTTAQDIAVVIGGAPAVGAVRVTVWLGLDARSD